MIFKTLKVKLIFATNNQHKVDEIRAFIGTGFEIITLKEAGIDVEIPEPFETLDENASTKSWTIHKMTRENCFSEDTGLEVFSLNNEPGVKSARYAGENRSFEDNIDKLLEKLKDNKDRSARFRTVISLIINGNETFFEGICTGKIIEKRSGINGFGYDSIFIPDEYNRTFAEMTMEEKSHLSHRTRATEKLVSFLKNINLNN